MKREAVVGRESVPPQIVFWGLAGVLLLAACVGPSLSPSQADPFTAHLIAGDADAARTRRMAAEASYQEAATVRPSHPAPYLRLARLYLDWNRLQEGLNQAAAAERLGARALEVARLRAALYTAQGAWDEVLAHGSAALGRDPDALRVRLQVARAHQALGQRAEAVSAYQDLLARDPTHAEANEELGVLLALSDPEGARFHLRMAGTPLALDVLAQLEEARDGSPAYRTALVGQVCAHHGAWSAAAAALEHSLTLEPLYADAHALLGHALDQLGQHDQALPHLEQALRLAPDSARNRSFLGLRYLTAGQAEAARPHLETAYELDPGNPALSLYLAYLYADLGRYDVAQAWLREAERLAPEDPSLLEAVARFYIDRQLPEGQEGLDAARALIAVAPSSAVAHDVLGQAARLWGSYAEAEEAFQRALALDPELTAAHFHLGQLYAALDRPAEARAALVRALDLATVPSLRSQIDQVLSDLP
jgi:tetratricopeptide (TPR) repeat protein